MTMKSEAKSTFVTLKKKEKRRNLLFKVSRVAVRRGQLR